MFHWLSPLFYRAPVLRAFLSLTFSLHLLSNHLDHGQDIAAVVGCDVPETPLTIQLHDHRVCRHLIEWHGSPKLQSMMGGSTIAYQNATTKRVGRTTGKFLLSSTASFLRHFLSPSLPSGTARDSGAFLAFSFNGSFLYPGVTQSANKSLSTVVVSDFQRSLESPSQMPIVLESLTLIVVSVAAGTK